MFQIKPKDLLHWLIYCDCHDYQQRKPMVGPIGRLFQLAYGHIKLIVGSFETKGNEKGGCKQNQRI